jgi:hypothetical protein
VPDSYDSSIPVLNDVLVPGNRALARSGAHQAPASTFAEAGPPALDPRLDPRIGPRFDPSVDPHLDPGAPVASFVPPQSVAPALAPADMHYDPELLAERLRGRFASYLTGEGRSVVEARCRDALNDHTTWLVNQITREVALALETELTGWVREAVREEMARRTPEH